MSPRLVYLTGGYRDTFRCEPYRCVMRRSACGVRWTIANNGSEMTDQWGATGQRTDNQLAFSHCIGCPIGERHSKEKVMPACSKCGETKRGRMHESGHCKTCRDAGGVETTAKTRESPSRKSKRKTAKAGRKKAKRLAPRRVAVVSDADPLVEYLTRVREVRRLEAELVEFVQENPEIVEHANDALGSLTTIGAQILEEVDDPDATDIDDSPNDETDEAPGRVGSTGWTPPGARAG